jgi:hypothetical protein
MRLPARAALANAWLLAPALAFAAAALLPEAAFLQAVEWLYLQLPIHAAVFRADLQAQTRVLHGACGPLALAALAVWAIATARGVSILAAAAGEEAGEGGAPRWRRRIVTALLAYSILLAPVRLLRDGLRERELAGLDFAARRLHVYGRHSLEPDYAALEAFRRSSGGEGAVLVLRDRRQLDFADVFAASYLFPQRVYVARVPECSLEEAARAAAARSDVAWLQLSCGGGPFAPQPANPR